MTFKRLSTSLVAVGFLLGANLAMAATPPADKAAEVAERTPGAVQKEATPKAAPAANAKAKIKLVDINGANKAALKKLPGIGDVEANKIVANRPYGSKMWLITDKVLERKTYDGIKGLIEAKQPYKTAEENAAMYEKLKREKAAKAKP